MRILLMKRQNILLVLAAVLVGFFFTNSQTSKAGSTLRLETLVGKTHIHGIAVDSADHFRLLPA